MLFEMDKHWNYEALKQSHHYTVSNSQIEIIKLSIYASYFLSTDFYLDTFAFYEETKCVQGHAIFMHGGSLCILVCPALYSIVLNCYNSCEEPNEGQKWNIEVCLVKRHILPACHIYLHDLTLNILLH
jgi:hypothetical protein